MKAGGLTLGLAAFAVVLCAFPSIAVEPNVSEIIPRGATRGSELTVRILGRNLSDFADLIVHDPGITLLETESVKGNEVMCKVAVAPDAALGVHALRVRTNTGVSNLRLFSVGALNQIDEAEPNGSRDDANVIELGSTVEGVITSEDADYFTVDLDEGQRLAVEIEAMRLGYAFFDPKLRLFAPGGHELLTEDDTATMGQDAAFVHHAKEAGRHWIVVSDAIYGGSGGHRYRLHVGSFPRPRAVSPLGGPPETEITLHWLGDPGLAATPRTLPAVDEGIVTLTATSDAGESPTPLQVRVANLPNTLEQEPNNARNEGTAATVPGAFEGILTEPGDIDHFKFTAKKGQEFEAQLWGRALGSPIDGVIRVRKADGGVIAGNDDAAGLDSKMNVKIPEDGEYFLEVHDHLRRGGEAFAYRVEVASQTPSLQVRLDPAQHARSLPRGQHIWVNLTPVRGGFGGDVQVTFENLPEGVEAIIVEDAIKDNLVPVLLKAAPDAPLGQALVDIRAVGKKGDQEVHGRFEGNVELTHGRNRTIFAQHKIDRFALAVTEAPPFTMTVDPPPVPGIRSAYVDVPVHIQRAEGFNGEVRLDVRLAPEKAGAGVIKVAPDSNEAQVRIELQPGGAVGTMPVIIRAISAGHTFSSQVVPIVVKNPPVQVAAEPLHVEQGADTAWTIKITEKLEGRGPVQLQLARLPKGVSTNGQFDLTDQTELAFPVTIAADAREGKFGHVVVQGFETYGDRQVPFVLGTAEMRVFKPLPPKLDEPEPEQKKDEPKKEKPKPPRTRFPSS